MDLLKKIIIFSLLCINISANVILKNGLTYSATKVEQIYSALKVLEQNHERLLIADLVKASDSDDLKLRRYNFTNEYFIDRSGYNIELEQLKNLELAQSLGLCDSEGNIEKEASEIIKCSVNVDYKGFCPVIVEVESPIAWKTYFTKEYWDHKKNEFYLFWQKQKSQ